MWRLYPLVLLRLASAFPASWNGTTTCPHDALYTSLVGDDEFCSSVLEGVHCGRGYSTPVQYVSYNQTRISSYCECILTASSAQTRSTLLTTGDNTLATTDAAPQTGRQSASETSESVGGRPGPSPSGSVRVTASDQTGSTTRGSWNETRSGSSTLGETTRDSTRTASGNDTSGLVTEMPRGSVTSTRGWWNTTETGTSRGRGTISVSASTIRNQTSDIWPTASFTQPWNRTQTPTESRETSSRARNTMSGSLPWPIPGNSTSGGVTPPTVRPTSTFVGWNSSIGLPTISWSGPGTAVPFPTDSLVVPSQTRSDVGGATSSGPQGDGSLTGPAGPTSTGGFSNSTSSRGSNATETGTPEFPAANFTQVTRTGVLSRETCHTLARDPEGDSTRRALLYNSRLREENVSIPIPYIESVEFESDGLKPLYLTVRDGVGGTYYVDISRRGQISIVDPAGNTMTLDAEGIHFSASNCTYNVSIRVKDMYEQIADLAGIQCAAIKRVKRMDDLDFSQVLYLRDQCGSPVDKSLRPYPQLLVGDTVCADTDVDENTGRWEFDCTFPGSASGALRCEWAIKNDIIDVITIDPFGGSCPDLSTVVTTLQASAQDILDPSSLRKDLYNEGLSDRGRQEADAAVLAYTRLWAALGEFFSEGSTSSGGSALEEYISVYNTHRSLENDICESLHAAEIPLNLSLVAGATQIPAITSLNWAPESTKPYNVTVQDPSQMACCPSGGVAETDDDGTCAYPREAIVEGTGCVCGRTVGGVGVAFEWAECDNFGGGCGGDGDCENGFMCLTGSCCGGGVCVDAFACSGEGVELVKFAGVV
ncbi:hypothetical protein FZEAL_8635 [Fusarium zealandicum]|uniref:Uncharacterized protein n=1 Tax=Fusarium zealandicum TaxID=1053134 RepID=A0A8H4UE64_9HYPO|nr:hypothetical protein FZEAL_8635 [Fusarium zealandicum]